MKNNANLKLHRNPAGWKKGKTQAKKKNIYLFFATWSVSKAGRKYVAKFWNRKGLKQGDHPVNYNFQYIKARKQKLRGDDPGGCCGGERTENFREWGCGERELTPEWRPGRRQWLEAVEQAKALWSVVAPKKKNIFMNPPLLCFPQRGRHCWTYTWNQLTNVHIDLCKDMFVQMTRS